VFPCLLSLPPYKLGKGEMKGNGTRPRTSAFAATGIPALFGIKHNGRFALFRVRNQNIDLAHIDALVAAVADLGIKGDRGAGGTRIGQGIDLFFFHFNHLMNSH
jgi:hypothetical protein